MTFILFSWCWTGWARIQIGGKYDFFAWKLSFLIFPFAENKSLPVLYSPRYIWENIVCMNKMRLPPNMESWKWLSSTQWVPSQCWLDLTILIRLNGFAKITKLPQRFPIVQRQDIRYKYRSKTRETNWPFFWILSPLKGFLTFQKAFDPPSPFF